MGLSVPISLQYGPDKSIYEGKTIAIKASDWNNLNSELNKFNTWLNTPKYISANGYDSVSPSSYTPSTNYATFSDISTTTVYSNNPIKAECYNELVQKINTWAKTKQPTAEANKTIISASLIGNLMNQLQYLPTSITINVTYSKLTEEGIKTTPGTVTFIYS